MKWRQPVPHFARAEPLVLLSATAGNTVQQLSAVQPNSEPIAHSRSTSTERIDHQSDLTFSQVAGIVGNATKSGQGADKKRICGVSVATRQFAISYSILDVCYNFTTSFFKQLFLFYLFPLFRCSFLFLCFRFRYISKFISICDTKRKNFLKKIKTPFCGRFRGGGIFI